MTHYKISLLEYDDCAVRMSPEDVIRLLKAWRKSHAFVDACSVCGHWLKTQPYIVCCDQFYFNKALSCYPVQSIAVYTPGYKFILPQLDKMITQARMDTLQDFLVIPDPIYWQVLTTLTYEKVLKFVRGLPVTRRTENVLPPDKSFFFYKQIQESPLNYGSLESRSCGKTTFIRQIAFGKRCSRSMRGMIVPDPSLPPNQIRIPDRIVNTFRLKGQWVILNRMPSLHMGNFVALQIPFSGPEWKKDCFGIPLEILESINGDFDGDECNVYLVPNMQSQAECASLLNAEWEMGSLVTGLKLAPSQDMLVAYYAFYDDIDFLPYKNRNLKNTFLTIYELYGSKVAFQAVDDMRKFYLKALQERMCFAITLKEINDIIQMAEGVCFETFERRARKTKGCLVTQVLAEAKGSFEHLYQMFGTIGQQENMYICTSFWKGLNPLQAIAHANTSYEALQESGKIWQPGYCYTKIAYNIHNITINYLGQLVDGEERILEKDALDALHHTDIMSEETFGYLLSKELVKEKC